MSVTIFSVDHDSPAEHAGILPGETLCSINGNEICDILDYRFYETEKEVLLLLRDAQGADREIKLRKGQYESIGLQFETYLMDRQRSCRNKCVFCFIDQLPSGMRESLYFKDDDSRLSFLFGNYITLTNLSQREADRIIKMKISPINISVHTTNPELRRRMLHNRFAGDIFPKVDRLYQAGIEMNGQIVLCKGINDAKELERSIKDLSQYLPHLKSVSVVPVGLSRFREGLYPLEPFDKEDACRVIDQIEIWQKRLYEQYGLHFIHASDEWYLLAERKLPEEERYDGYLQLENGVGMLRLLEEQVTEALEGQEGDDRRETLAFATGNLAYPFISRYMEKIQKKFPNVQVRGYNIKNCFFGEQITVSGLLTGQDLIQQLKGKELGEYLLLPCNMLRSGENVFLDDVTVEDVERELKVSVKIVGEEGADLIEAVLNREAGREHKRRQMYEQTNCSYSGTAQCGKIHTF